MRLFDTYLSDDNGFAVLQVYVSAALILKYANRLKKMNFNEIILLLQNLPTKEWSPHDVEMLI
jgi:hypothetical protein